MLVLLLLGLMLLVDGGGGGAVDVAVAVAVDVAADVAAAVVVADAAVVLFRVALFCFGGDHGLRYGHGLIGAGWGRGHEHGHDLGRWPERREGGRRTEEGRKAALSGGSDASACLWTNQPTRHFRRSSRAQAHCRDALRRRSRRIARLLPAVRGQRTWRGR